MREAKVGIQSFVMTLDLVKHKRDLVEHCS